MVARGVLHGCIGACCSANYPSVFANLGDKEIWDFVQGKAIKLNVDKGCLISESILKLFPFSKLCTIIYSNRQSYVFDL